MRSIIQPVSDTLAWHPDDTTLISKVVDHDLRHDRLSGQLRLNSFPRRRQTSIKTNKICAAQYLLGVVWKKSVRRNIYLELDEKICVSSWLAKHIDLHLFDELDGHRFFFVADGKWWNAKLTSARDYDARNNVRLNLPTANLFKLPVGFPSLLRTTQGTAYRLQDWDRLPKSTCLLFRAHEAKHIAINKNWVCGVAGCVLKRIQVIPSEDRGHGTVPWNTICWSCIIYDIWCFNGRV